MTAPCRGTVHLSEATARAKALRWDGVCWTGGTEKSLWTDTEWKLENLGRGEQAMRSDLFFRVPLVTGRGTGCGRHPTRKTGIQKSRGAGAKGLSLCVCV